MPAAIAVPLITAGVSAGAGIAGSKIAANASKKAAKTQADASLEAQRSSDAATARALDYIESMRTGGMPRTEAPAASYLSRLLGVGPRQASPMLRGSGAGPMVRPQPVGMKPGVMAGGPSPMGVGPTIDPYQRLFGIASQAARTVGGRR